MRKHTENEMLRMAELVHEALTELFVSLGQSSEDAKARAHDILSKNVGSLNHVLNLPHGGALSPEELAEMLLSQFVYQQKGLFDEKAAATVITA